MKIYVIAIAVIGSNLVFGEGLGLPTREQLEQQGIETSFPENNRPLDWDTRPPEAGKIRLYVETILQETKEEIGNDLAEVPDGAEGKGSVLHGKITQWLQEVDQQLLNKTRIGLLDLIPLHAEVFANIGLPVPSDSPLMSAVAKMQDVAKALVYNMADFVSENPAPTVGQHDKMIVGFCIHKFTEEGQWEDEPLPIDSAGVFVTDAANATAKLKTKTLEEIKTFLRGSTDSSFFERYEAAGDGMDILKTKYASNKAAIHAKFDEVIAFVAQLENQ